MITEEKPEMEWKSTVQLLSFKRSISKAKQEKKVTFSFSFHTEVLKSHSASPNQELSS